MAHHVNDVTLNTENYTTPRDVTDPTLALIRQVWAREHRLDGYLAWLLRHPYRFLDGHGGPASPVVQPEVLTDRWRTWLAGHTADTVDTTRYP